MRDLGDLDPGDNDDSKRYKLNDAMVSFNGGRGWGWEVEVGVVAATKSYLLFYPDPMW